MGVGVEGGVDGMGWIGRRGDDHYHQIVRPKYFSRLPILYPAVQKSSAFRFYSASNKFQGPGKPILHLIINQFSL